MRRAALLALVLAFIGTSSASAAWTQPIGGPTPIRTPATVSASGTPDLHVIGGVPHVSWSESYPGFAGAQDLQVARLNSAGTAWERLTPDPPAGGFFVPPSDPSLGNIGTTPYLAYATSSAVANQDVMVRRINAAGTGWEDVGGPLDQIVGNPATDPSLTMINGVPYVAWKEDDGTNTEIRVAHLNGAGNAWVRDADGGSPINASNGANADLPSITSVNGTPWVAWREMGAGNQGDIHAAFLNAAGTQWLDKGLIVDKVASADAQGPNITTIDGVPWLTWVEAQGPSYQVRVAKYENSNWVRVADADAPINRDPSRHTNSPSLAAIGGTPYVAWHEADSVNSEVRVARLNSTGTAWERVVDTDSPINQDPSQTAIAGNLVDVNGVPYVVWMETNSDGNREVRVARLEPEFVSQAAAPASTSATLSATWRTYGLSFPIGFEYGTSLEASTAPTSTPLGQDTVTITQELAGLSPTTAYPFRSFALPGTEPRVLAGTEAFTTTTAPPATDTTPPETTITKDPPNKLKKSKAKYKFTSNEPGSTFVCKFDRKKPKPCDAGKFKAKRLDDGKHKFRVYAVDAAGNQDRTPAKDKFKVL